MKNSRTRKCNMPPVYLTGGISKCDNPMPFVLIFTIGEGSSATVLSYESVFTFSNMAYKVPYSPSTVTVYVALVE